MAFASLNWLAILGATFGAFLAGGLWFGPKTFFPVWWRAMGRDPSVKPAGDMNMGLLFGSTAAAAFVQAVVVALVCQLSRAGNPAFSAVDGALVGALLGVGLAAASSLSHRLFGGFGYKVWLIEVGSDALNLTIMGLIIGNWP